MYILHFINSAYNLKFLITYWVVIWYRPIYTLVLNKGAYPIFEFIAIYRSISPCKLYVNFHKA